MGRKQFDESYKQEVVELSYRRDNIQDLARELGLRAELIYRWRRERAGHVPDSDKEESGRDYSELELENRRLKRALKELEEDKVILKKAIDIFSQRDGRSSN